VPASRITTAPVIVTTLSGRTASAAAKVGEPGEHTLRHAVMVAQVDEQQAAMVAPGVHPAREAGIPDSVGDTEGATGVSATGVHALISCRFVRGGTQAPAGRRVGFRGSTVSLRDDLLDRRDDPAGIVVRRE
jgi:hypothetical protein